MSAQKVINRNIAEIYLLNKIATYLNKLLTSYIRCYTFEDCDMVSYGDPEQGFTAKNWVNSVWYDGWVSYEEIYEKYTKQMEKPNNF